MVATITRRSGIWVLFMVIASSSVGCSSFNREWDSARPPDAPHDMTGRWQGTWRSSADGHTGQLKCVITELSVNQYRAHFAATYWKILHFDYTTLLNAKPPTNGQIPLEGQSDLGFLAGGVYTYNGHATASEFFCEYKSKYDFGIFRMARGE